jgi:hypothetical protein
MICICAQRSARALTLCRVIPTLDAGGRLPPGRHAATLAEVEDLFVANAPNVAERERLFQALGLYLAQVRDLFASGVIWLDGGFVTHKPEVPDDIDLALALTAAEVNALPPAQLVKMPQLLTLQGVPVPMFTGPIPRIQPMGGLIDAHVVDLSDPASIAVWHDTWSRVMDAATKKVIPGLTKGYLEVAW